MKKLFCSIVLLFSSIYLFSQGKSLSENEKIQFAMLMNQVQYTTSNIIQTQDREILTQEFDFIINQIDKSKLYDYTIKNSYVDLLETIMQLKLSENERFFTIEMNERERKQAYAKALSSFGSVFNAGFSPYALVASIAYAGISAGLNIANAKYEADNKLKEKLFKIDQKELENIDDLRKNLFSSYIDVITSYKIPSKYEISETEMKDFIKQLSDKKDNHKDLIRILESKKTIFEYVPVYWFQLGSQYQYSGNTAKALECYAHFESLKSGYSYLKTDPYYISVAKNKIEILKNEDFEKNKQQILNYLQIIENNLIPENESENRVFLAGVYFQLGQNSKAKSLLKLNIARNEYYAVSADMLALIEYEESRLSNTLNPAILLELSTIKINISEKEDYDLSITIPRRFGAGKYIYVIFNGKVYTNQIFSTSQSTSDCILSYKVGINNKNQNELNIGIVNDKNQVIELIYECAYIKANSTVSKLLTEIETSFEDIEPCLLPVVFERLNKFSYKPENDKEYIDLVELHKKQISKQTSKEQKQVFKKEEKEKLQELKTRGRLRSITNELSVASKDLQNYPYFCSRSAISEKANLFCYSLTNVKYFSDEYNFQQFGLGTKNTLSKTAYPKNIQGLIEKTDKDSFYDLYKAFCTGNSVQKDGVLAFRYLVLAANNNNVNAQYDLATVYSDTSSSLSKFFMDAGIIIPDTGLISSVANVIKKNETIEKEKIATYWYKRASDNGHKNATFEYAKRLESGMGVEKNLDLAKEYYKKAFYDYGILEAEKKISK